MLFHFHAQKAGTVVITNADVNSKGRTGKRLFIKLEGSSLLLARVIHFWLKVLYFHDQFDAPAKTMISSSKTKICTCSLCFKHRPQILASSLYLGTAKSRGKRSTRQSSVENVYRPGPGFLPHVGLIILFSEFGCQQRQQRKKRSTAEGKNTKTVVRARKLFQQNFSNCLSYI